jgi:hypothetical protein
MARLLSSAVTWIIILLLAIIALLAGIVLGWFDTGGGTPSPGASASPTVSHSPEDLSGFVERGVTPGEYVPSAEVLTLDVLVSAGSGWVLAIDDTSQIDTAVDPHSISASGPKILYLISPDGTRYEVANLNTLGLMAPDLVAWDNLRDLILIEEQGSTLNVFDMATGEISSLWTFCEDTGYIESGQARSDNWLVRGGCQGEGIDGVYTDAGSLTTSGYPIVGLGSDLTVIDVGDVQVSWEWEGSVEEKFLATFPDGSTDPLPWSAAGECYPLDKGNGATVAMYCDSGTGHYSVWELPVDGSSPYQVISSTQWEDFLWTAAALTPEDNIAPQRYCSGGTFPMVQANLGDELRLGILNAGMLESAGPLPFRYRACHAVAGSWALLSGNGHLWWYDFATGGEVVMLPGRDAGSPIQVVGTDGYTALRLP